MFLVIFSEAGLPNFISIGFDLFAQKLGRLNDPMNDGMKTIIARKFFLGRGLNNYR